MKNKILMLLSETDGYLSGQEISNKFNVTRSAVWKNINLLRKEGYVINSGTNKGYKLVSSPNLLNQQQIIHMLKTNWIGKQLQVLDETPSTNDVIKHCGEQGCENGYVATTEQQTRGKGRLGRQWLSPYGKDICVSILLRPQIAINRVAFITLCAGLAVCKAIREYANIDAKIKWPNDVIVGNKKLCGILTEMSADMDRVEYVTVGIGINVNIEEFPQEIAHKATSVKLEAGKEINRQQLLCKVLEQFEKTYEAYIADGEAGILKEYKNLCATIGREVSAKRADGSIVGYAVDISPSGGLIIERDDTKTEISSGEVTVQGIY